MSEVRKKVLFFAGNFDRGGAEISSTRMINSLAERNWDVTLLTISRGGEMQSMLDDSIKRRSLKPCPYLRKEQFQKGGPFLRKIGFLAFFFVKIICDVCGGLRAISLLNNRYDAAVLLTTGCPSWFVRYFTRAPVKIRWIRNDLAHSDFTGQVTANLGSEAPFINRFVCVSSSTRESLLTALPGLRDKAEVIYNILRPELMRARATEAHMPFPTELGAPIRILSVCRLSDRAKALFRMVILAERLATAGHDFRWYIAGDGNDRAALQSAIDAAKLSDRMILLGALKNPFPAYNAADIVAMLSYYEGLCGVVNEARVLGRAVIATEVSGIREQLTDGVNGLVVPQDEDAIFVGLERLIVNAELRARIATGGYPDALLNDTAKLDRIEALFLGKVV